MRVNPIRFTGMASGMDTDSIVKDLMGPQRLKVDREKKAQALIALRQDAWKEMNKKLYDFHTGLTHKLSQVSTFRNNITTSSNTNAISIDSGATVPQGTHKFEVTKLAEAAAVVGQVNGGKGLSGKTTMSELVDGQFTIPDKLVMKVNGTPITVNVTAGSTLNQIAQDMNKELKDTGFTAQYDEKNGSFFVRSTSTGVEQTIEFSNDNSEGAKLFERMGMGTGKLIKGADAEYSYNGVGGFTSSSNKIEINGIKATLKAENAGEIITITSEPDIDATYAFIKEFVEEYNKLIDEINEKLGTKPAKGIEPLTSEEREAMSDSDIKLWEDKINKSLFYKDAQLESFISSTRNIVGTVHKNEFNPDAPKDALDKYTGDELVYKSLASLGIVTGKWEERGKLQILGDGEDTNRLKEAIANNPEDVMKFFTTLGKKLYDSQWEALKSSDLKSARIFYNDKVMEKQVKSHAKQILTLEERMYKMEQMHYAKFAAMEKMLSSLNNQSSWLSQQFGG